MKRIAFAALLWLTDALGAGGALLLASGGAGSILLQGLSAAAVQAQLDAILV